MARAKPTATNWLEEIRARQAEAKESAQEKAWAAHALKKYWRVYQCDECKPANTWCDKCKTRSLQTFVRLT